MKIRLAVVVTVVLAGALAQPAMGAGVFLERTCLREGSRSNFIGVGYQPGQPVAASLDGRQFATGAADALGRVPGFIVLPSITRSEQTRALTITQVTNPAITGTTPFKETSVYVVTKPRRFRPGTRLRIRAGGFYGAGSTLYAHVRGPRRRNVRIGRITGDCGKVSATRKALLRKGDRAGFYTVQFDGVRRYVGRRAPLWLRMGFTIRRIFRFSRSSSFARPVLPGTVEGEIRGAG